MNIQSTTIQPIDVVGFERCVGGKIKRIAGRNEGDSASLLVTEDHVIDTAKITRGPQDTALRTIVPSQNPEALLPLVIHDVMHVSDGTFWERVGDVPRGSMIVGGIDVDFVAIGVVKVFSPEDLAIRSGSDVQGACAAKNFIRNPKFSVAGNQPDNCARNCSQEMAGSERGESVEPIAADAIGKARGGTEGPPPRWMEAGDHFPTCAGSIGLGTE